MSFVPKMEKSDNYRKGSGSSKKWDGGPGGPGSGPYGGGGPRGPSRGLDNVRGLNDVRGNDHSEFENPEYISNSSNFQIYFYVSLFP